MDKSTVKDMYKTFMEHKGTISVVDDDGQEIVIEIAEQDIENHQGQDYS